MKRDDFIRKYPALDSIGFRIDSALMRESAENLTITRSSERMPTAPETGKSKRGLPRSVYSNALKYVLDTMAEKRPEFTESLNKVVQDFDAMMQEEYKFKRYGGMSKEQMHSAMANTIERMPENAVDYTVSLLNERARGDETSIADAAENMVKDNAGKLADNVNVLKALEQVHANRSLGWKILHPFKNLGEWMAIRSIKGDLKESAGEQEFEKEYQKEPERYDFKESDGNEIKASDPEAQAQRESALAAPEREIAPISEAEIEEPASEISQPVQQTETVNNNLQK
ncbi:MAG: hypothetical protein ACI4QN_01020 [Candidatus Coproplasma sp.]